MNIIFIDVDGVLNPWKPASDFIRHDISVLGTVYAVYLNPQHGDWLKQLAKDTSSELVWGTTWQELANPEISVRIGLPELPYLTLKPAKFRESLGSIKGRAAVEYAKSEKFVYFDDEQDIGSNIGGSNGLHICVNYQTGLQLSHIETARSYLLS